MKQSEIFLKKQGVKGGKVHPSFEGCIIADIDGDKRIVIDAFCGMGDTYKRREECAVIIKQRDKTIFDGSISDLIKKLTN